MATQERDEGKMNTTERRFRSTLRAAEEAGGRYLSGYAARFNSLSEDLGGFRERLAPGCFARSLQSGDPRMLLDHDTGKLLGRKSAGTLEISEDAKGLRFRCELPDTTAGRDVYESVRRGDLSGCSFGFMCRSSDWSTETDPDDADDVCSVRTVTQADLHEISAVTFPAYLATNVDASQRAAALFPGGDIPAEIRQHVSQHSNPRFARLKAIETMLARENRDRLERLRITL